MAAPLSAPYRLRKPLAASSPPLCAAPFFLFTCLRPKLLALAVASRGQKPGETSTEDAVRLGSVQEMREGGEEQEEEDEGLGLCTEEYPELWRSMLASRNDGSAPECGRGSLLQRLGWPAPSASDSQRLSSSLEAARQCWRESAG